MEITLSYNQKTGGGTVIVFSQLPVETVGVQRIERKFGAPVNTPVRKVTKQLLVSPDGLLNLELTKLNAKAIKQFCSETGDFDLLDPDQMVLVDAMLGGQMADPGVAPASAQPKRKPGRPVKQPAPAEVPPAAANIVSA